MKKISKINLSTPNKLKQLNGFDEIERKRRKRLIIYKSIGIALLLLNLIYTIILCIYFKDFLKILLQLWPFTLIYFIGLIFTFIGIIWNFPFLFWPTIILKIPLMLTPLIIFLLYFTQLLCKYSSNINNYLFSNILINLECKNNQQNNYFTNFVFQKENLCQITKNSFSLIFNLLIFFLIFLEKLLELIFFVYLKRKIKQNLIKKEERKINDKLTFSCSGKIITRKIPKRNNFCCRPSKIDEEEDEDITIYDKCQHLSGWKPRLSNLKPPPPLPIINKNGKEII